MKEINKNITYKDKYIISVVFLVPLAILFLFMIKGLFFDPTSRKDYFLKEREERSFNGVVDTIFRQRDNHNIMTVGSKGRYFEVEARWEGKFRIGDSISKQPGVLILEYYRNGKLIEKLFYGDIAIR